MGSCGSSQGAKIAEKIRRPMIKMGITG